MAGTGTAHLRDADDVVLRVEDLVVEFQAKQGRKVHAVSGISFDVRAGETVGLVGESGCGKSTTGRAVMQLPPPTSGSIRFDGVELTTLGTEDLRRTRVRLQMIFQDPISSLNPRRKVRDIVAEGLNIWGRPDTVVDDVLESVGLDPAVGFLHRDRPGRPSLALDLMEEFRPFFADRLALSLINRRQVSAKGFRRMENGACLMTDDLRKDVLVAYQERTREELRHPYLGEPTTVGLLWHLQAQLLARHLRGDLDGYPPFVWR